MTSSEAEGPQKLAHQKLQYFTRSKLIQDFYEFSVAFWSESHVEVVEDHMEVTRSHLKSIWLLNYKER